MDQGKLLTEIFIAVTALTIALYDLIVWTRLGLQDTITDVVRNWAEQAPILVYLLALGMGALFGHLFLGSPSWSFKLLIGTLVFIVGSLVGHYILK